MLSFRDRRRDSAACFGDRPSNAEAAARARRHRDRFGERIVSEPYTRFETTLDRTRANDLFDETEARGCEDLVFARAA